MSFSLKYFSLSFIFAFTFTVAMINHSELLFGAFHLLFNIFILSGLSFEVFNAGYLNDDDDIINDFVAFCRLPHNLVIIYTHIDIELNVFLQIFLTNEADHVAFRIAIIARFRCDLIRVLVEENEEFFPPHVMNELDVYAYIDLNAVVVFNDPANYPFVSYASLLSFHVAKIFQWLFEQCGLDYHMDHLRLFIEDNNIEASLDFDMTDEYSTLEWIHPNISSPIEFMRHAVQPERWQQLLTMDLMSEWEVVQWVRPIEQPQENEEDDDEESDDNDDNGDDNDDSSDDDRSW